MVKAYGTILFSLIKLTRISFFIPATENSLINIIMIIKKEDNMAIPVISIFANVLLQKQLISSESLHCNKYYNNYFKCAFH